jgi:hypothetical protein
MNFFQIGYVEILMKKNVHQNPLEKAGTWLACKYTWAMSDPTKYYKNK